MDRFHFTPAGYLDRIRDEVSGYDELQDHVADATRGITARRLLDLGVGTGETARRVLELHPAARLTGIDESPEMLAHARATLPAGRIDALAVGRLEDPLPAGPFDLVVSALAVHHLDPDGKIDLFRRIHPILGPGARFVLGDVVVPDQSQDAVIPLTPGYDLPDRVDAQLAWLEAAGFAARPVWAQRDIAVLVADRR